MGRLTGFGQSVAGALAMAAVSTLGDFIWYAGDVEHQMVVGLVHGALLCMVLGLMLGVFAEGGGPSVVRGVIGAPVIGVVAAGAFYLLAPIAGRSAMLLAWMLLWILMGLLNRHVRGIASPFVPAEPIGTALLRGAAAAVLSGVAFWSISGIWIDFHVAPPNYAWNFMAWTMAFFPGFLPLLVERRR